MIKKLIVVCFLFITLVSIQSCESENSAMTETHNAEETDIIVSVKTFTTQDKLNKYVRKHDLEVVEVEGLAQWRLKKGEDVPYRCDIYVVKPKSSKDYETQETWGHELMHCIYGSYHRKNER